MSDPNARTGPDVETTGAADDAAAGTANDGRAWRRRAEPTGDPSGEEAPEQEEGAEEGAWEPHLHPERLAMTGEDVLHAFDPRHWLPPNRRDDADEEYPHIRADWPAPFG